MELFLFFFIRCSLSDPKVPDFEDDIYSWVYLDQMNDPFYFNFTKFETSNSNPVEIDNENDIHTITVDANSKVTSVLSINEALDKGVAYTHFFIGYNQNQADLDTTNDPITISLIFDETEICKINYGEMKNDTLSLNISQISTVSLIIENSGNEKKNLIIPNVTLFRYVNIIDNDYVRRSMVMDHMKATQCNLKLDEDFGNVEIETVRLKNIHQIPNRFQNSNMKFVNGEEFSILPILANSEKIIGFNVLDSDILHFWKIKNVDDMYSFSMRLRPLKSFTMSYIIIETSSKDYYEALEIWQHSFPLIYNSELKGSFVSESGNSIEAVLRPFSQIFEKGNQTQKDNVMHFYQIPDFTISIPISPENISNGNCSQEYIDKCNYIENYGIKLYQNGCLNYLYNHSDSTYIYYVEFTKEFSNYLSNFKTTVSKNYDGIFFENFDNFNIDYNINNDSAYALLENYKLFIPVMTSYFRFLTFYFSITKNGYLFEGDWIHPQFASYCTSFMTYSNMCENSQKFNFGDDNKQKFWGIKAVIGSKSFSLVENGYTQQYYQELFSVASYLGAYVTSSNNDKLAMLLLLNDGINWVNLLNEKNLLLLYYQIDFVIDFGDNTSNIDYSLFCKEVDEYQYCYLDLFIPSHNDKNLNFTILKSGSNVLGCYHSPGDVKCNTSENRVNIALNNNKIRTVTLVLSIPIEQNVVNWFSINYGLVILATIPMIALLVCLGFGFWYMFCKKPSSDEILEKIIKNAKNMRKEKKRDKSNSSTKVNDDEI